MKKIFVLLFFLSSCSYLKQNRVCGDIILNIHNNNDILFISQLKKSLNNKLSTIKNKDINTTCVINMNTNINDYFTIVDTSGFASRKNFKIITNYTINFPDNRQTKNNVILFYGVNISENYYSEYVYREKRQENNINLLSNKLFYSILNDINVYSKKYRLTNI